MLPTSLPGGRPGGDHLGPPDLGAGRELREARHARRFERRAAAELVERNVGTTVGNEHEVLHGDESNAARRP